MTGIVLSYVKFPEEKKVKIFNNVLTQILVNSNLPFRGLLCETQEAGLHVSEWKILIRRKTISYKNCYRENSNM